MPGLWFTRCAAAAVAVAAAALPAAAGATAARPHARVAPGPAAAIAITSVTPDVAGPHTKVTVSGIVINESTQPLTGLSVQLWSSSNFLSSRDALDNYLFTHEPTNVDTPEGLAQPLAATLKPQATQRWRLTLEPDQVGMRYFGVYPLAVQLSSVLGPLDAARTLLPFWPGKTAAHSVKPVNVGWVWPLIDSPQQTTCPALLTNELATSTAPGGRLNGLLTAGQSAAGQQARLTWAIDPALLADARAMTHPYRVGPAPTCGGGTPQPASASVRAWLAGVKSVTASQDYFVTPYADVDVAALAHRGLDSELSSAFTDGQRVSKQMLGGGQRTTPAVAGAMAWPPDGVADYGVLEGLAASGVRTVILDSSMMPPAQPVTYTPGAVTTTTDGQGQRLHVLLADQTLTHILSLGSNSLPGVVPGPSPKIAPAFAEAAAFAKEQWFLAETAMIAAEAPAASTRSLVVAPPRRWDPPAGMAEALLNETVQAPWLRPATLAGLATARADTHGVPRHQPSQNRRSGSELRPSLLHQVRALSGQIQLLTDILPPGGESYLSTSLAAVESSAWRGSAAGRHRAQQLVSQVSAYVAAQLNRVQIIDTPHITLGGKSGFVPVTVYNHLPQMISVRLQVSVPPREPVTIGWPSSRVIKVARQTQSTIKIPVRAANAGSTKLTLRLITLSGQALPAQSSLVVEATHFGTLAIAIIVAALVVFVITAAGRAIRRGGGPGGEEQPEEPGEDDGDQVDAAGLTAAGAGTGNAPGWTGVVEESPESPSDAVITGGEADSVVPGAEHPDTAKEADEHASTPGRAHHR